MADQDRTGGARRLPPLNALRAFEAAARLGSLARAADELHVTAGAVSQHVRQLEALLGVSLFRRHARGVELTDEAAAALPALSDAFDRMRQAGEALAGAVHHDHVRVGAPADFAAKWLSPRLATFQEAHPQFSVSLIATGGRGAIERFEVELEVRFEPVGAGALERRRLLSESLEPAASPERVAQWRAAGLDTEGILLSAPLIHDVSVGGDPGTPDWTRWLAGRGLARPDAARGDRFGGSDQVVDAAVAGRGLALVKRTLAYDAVAQGRLSPLMAGGGTALTWTYDVVWPSGRRLGAAARAMVAFLEAQAAPFEHMGV